MLKDFQLPYVTNHPTSGLDFQSGVWGREVFLMFLKEVSYAPQGFIYLIKTIKYADLLLIIINVENSCTA